MQHIKAKISKTCSVHHCDMNYLLSRSNFTCVMQTVKSCIENYELSILPPSSGDFPAFTPAEAGTRFGEGCKAMVVTSQYSLPAKDGHLSQSQK